MKIVSNGVSVEIPSGVDISLEQVQELLTGKQDLLTGTQGQVVGFDSEGKAVAQDAPSIPLELVAGDGIEIEQEGNTLTISASGGGSDGGEVYSTEEQVIGRWIDGKLLYGKVIIADNLQPGNHMIESFPSADYFCVSRFRYLRTDGYSMLFSGADITTVNGVICGAVPYMTPQSGLMVNINYYTISRLIMAVEYTKHADQATIELPAMLSRQNSLSFNMETQAIPTAAVTAGSANILIDPEVTT